MSCSLTGTFVLGGGALGLTPPDALGWGGSVTGVDQALADTTGAGADEKYVVNDSTGAGSGWHVTASATPFTSLAPAATLSDTGTFETNGSVADETAVTSPTAACSAATACTLPTNGTTYPVDITTAAVATAPTIFTIYAAALGTGVGSIVIGGSASANPVGWWLNVPGNTLAGTYTSTVTMAVIDAP